MSDDNEFGQFEALNKKLDDVTQKFLSMSNDLSEADNSLIRKDTDAAGLIFASKELEKEIDDCSSKIDTLQLSSNTSERTHKKLDKSASKEGAQNEADDTEPNYIEKLKLFHEAKIRELQGSLLRLHLTINTRNAEIYDLKYEKCTVQAERDTLEMQMKELRKEIIEVRNCLSEVRKDLSNVRSELFSTQSRIITFEENNSVHKGEIVAIMATNSEKGRKITEFQECIDRLHSTVKSQQSSFMEHEISNTEEKRNLMVEIQAVIDQSQELKKELLGVTGELSSAKSGIDNLQEERSMLQVKNGNIQKELAEVNGVLSSVQCKIIEIEEEKSLLETNLIAKVAAEAQANSIVTSNLSSTQARVVALEEDKSMLQEEIVAMLAINTDNHLKIIEFQASVDQLQSAVIVQQENFVEYDAANNEEKRHLAMEIQAAVDQSEELKKGLVAVTGELSSAKSGISTLQEENATLQITSKGIQSELAERKEVLSLAQSKIIEMEQEKSMLESSLATTLAEAQADSVVRSELEANLMQLDKDISLKFDEIELLKNEFEESYAIMMQENIQDRESITMIGNTSIELSGKMRTFEEGLIDFELCLTNQFAEIENLKAGCADEKVILAGKETEIKSLIEQSINLQMENVEVANDLSCEQLKSFALETDKSTLEKNIKTLKIALTENLSQDQNNDDFQSSLSKLRLSISSSNEKFKILKLETKKHDLKMKDEMEGMASPSQLIINESQDLRVELAKVTTELSSLQSSHHHIEEENLQLRNTIITSKKELKHEYSPTTTTYKW
jgi:chromosome segregation ATPase